MGTTFANLQIRSQSVTGIEDVLPGSIVRCLSEGWTTVVNEQFQVGDIEKSAKRLSKTITPGVMSIEYFDDDVFKLSIYRNGKRITRHVAGGDGYGMANKLGKPQLILEHLEFESSEMSYLKAILACGDLGRKLELLQQFLGVRIWIDHLMLLDEPKTDLYYKRDIPSIESYMKETKRARVKNQAKANLVQEFEGALIAPLGDDKFLIGVPPYDRQLDCYTEELIYNVTSNASIEPMLDVTSFQYRFANGELRAAHGNICFMSFTRGKYYVFDYSGTRISETALTGLDFSPINMLENGGFIGSKDRQLTLGEYDRSLNALWEIPYTGFPYYFDNAVYLNKDVSERASELIKINRSGEVAASLLLDFDGYHDHLGKFIFEEGGRVYYVCNATTPGRPLMKIFVLSEQMELIKEMDLDGWSIHSMLLDSINHRLLVHLSYTELVVIDTRSFLVVSRRPLGEDSSLFAVDADGRTVVLTGMSTIEILDAKMQDISRHRLKGRVNHHFISENGNLCFLTSTGGEHDEGGARKMMIRVYELSV